jgi:hypothetical protein
MDGDFDIAQSESSATPDHVRIADDGSAAFGLHNGRYPFKRNDQLSATVDVHVKKVRE